MAEKEISEKTKKARTALITRIHTKVSRIKKAQRKGARTRNRRRS